MIIQYPYPFNNTLLNVGWDSSVSIVNHYELDGLGSNPSGGEIFHTHPGPGVHPASCTMGTRSLSLGQHGQGMTLTKHPPFWALAIYRVDLIRCIQKVTVQLGYSTKIWLSVSKLLLKCAVVSLYSVVKQQYQ
jgi:hypothetical protein